jgi:serine/threonine protein kinase
MRDGKAPDTVGRYQITDRLASGGTSELFKGVFVGEYGFKKPIAIKRLLPHLAADPSAVEMFLDEARIAARLNHRNIIEVLELGSDAETQYMAMQFVDGIDLLGLASECTRTQLRMPPELAALIVREVLDALDYAHHAKDPSGRPLEIVHRDVSPGNVMLSWNGDVKLVDFGRALGSDRRHKTKGDSLRGKCGYMSPEQVSGGTVDVRSDLFQAGILLAELVLGRSLFGAARELDVLVMVRECNLATLDANASEFPIDLLAITLRALQRMPDDRWSSAAEFRDALDEWIANTARVTRRELAALLARLAGAPTKYAATALGSGALAPMPDLDDQVTTISGAPDVVIETVEDSTSRMDASQMLTYLAAEQAATPKKLGRAQTDPFDSHTFENRLEQSIRIASGTANRDESVVQAAEAAQRAEQVAEEAPVDLRPRSRLPLVALGGLIALGSAVAYFWL